MFFLYVQRKEKMILFSTIFIIKTRENQFFVLETPQNESTSVQTISQDIIKKMAIICLR